MSNETGKWVVRMLRAECFDNTNQAPCVQMDRLTFTDIKDAREFVRNKIKHVVSNSSYSIEAISWDSFQVSIKFSFLNTIPNRITRHTDVIDILEINEHGCEHEVTLCKSVG